MRALSQWRSSWLSREGIIAPLALAVLFAHSVAAWQGSPWAAAMGLIAAVLCVGAVFAHVHDLQADSRGGRVEQLAYS